MDTLSFRRALRTLFRAPFVTIVAIVSLSSCAACTPPSDG